MNVWSNIMNSSWEKKWFPEKTKSSKKRASKAVLKSVLRKWMDPSGSYLEREYVEIVERIILDDYENAYCKVITDDQGEVIRLSIYSSITMQHMFLSVPVK